MKLTEYLFSPLDQTAPIIRITSNLPPLFSNEQQWIFTFECRDASPCSTYCSVHLVGSVPNFETCSRSWTASGFVNGDHLEFVLQGIDSVGNIAPVMTHQWTVGKTIIAMPYIYATFHESCIICRYHCS